MHLPGLLSSLRARVVLALGVFALAMLVALGGTSWLLLRDLHRDAATGALSDLVVPYVAQAREQLGPGPGHMGRGGLGDGLDQALQFLQQTQQQVESAGVSVLLVREDGLVMRANASGQVDPTGQALDISIPDATGAVTRGVVAIPDQGTYLYAATPIFGDRMPGGVRSIVLVRPDDSERLATDDLARALLVSLLVLAIVGLPLAAWLARSVARPLDRLASASATVARGDVPAPLPTDGPAEVATASAAFNAMADEVALGRETQRQLLADLRHDLRTPLTVIGGFAEALRDGTAQGPHVQQAADAIADEAARLERMLGDLGDLAELERGGRPMRQEVLDGRAIVRESSDRFRATAAGRGQRLEVDAPARSLPLLGDHVAIERIMANLVANAIAHAPSPSGRVWLETRSVTSSDPPVGGRQGWAGRAGVVLAVRDDGPGIPRDALPRVFDRFFRANPARSGPGSGLGLAIVAELAHAQDGRAFAENVAGGGARVGVVLPAADGLDAAPLGVVEPAPA
jgi:signal transduction histidine kinase